MTWDAFINTVSTTTPSAAASISYNIIALSEDGKQRMELSGFPVRPERWTRTGSDAVLLIPAKAGEPAQVGKSRGRFVFWVREEVADTVCEPQP